MKTWYMTQCAIWGLCDDGCVCGCSKGSLRVLWADASSRATWQYIGNLEKRHPAYVKNCHIGGRECIMVRICKCRGKPNRLCWEEIPSHGGKHGMWVVRDCRPVVRVVGKNVKGSGALEIWWVVSLGYPKFLRRHTHVIGPCQQCIPHTNLFMYCIIFCAFLESISSHHIILDGTKS